MAHFGFSRDSSLMDITPLENLFIQEYLPAAPEGFVKVFILGLMQCYTRNDELDMEHMLKLSTHEILKAYIYWEERGLVKIVSESPLEVEYRNAKHNLFSGAGNFTPPLPSKYADLVFELQAVLKTRQLTASELSRIYDWVEVFNIEQPAVLLLVRHCIAAKGARVSIKYMDAVARSWADANVLSAAQAQEYIDNFHELSGGVSQILKRWRFNRLATHDELELYKRWTKEWGFDEEAVLMAATLTTGTDKPTFNYLNGILKNFREKNIFTSDAIRKQLKKDEALNEHLKLIFERAGIQRSTRITDGKLLSLWLEDWKLPFEMVLLAAEYSSNAGSPFVQIKKLIENWHQLGINTVSAARKAHETKFKNITPKANTPVALNYSQNRYTKEELQHIAADIDKLAGEIQYE